MVPSHHKSFISIGAIVLWCEAMSNILELKLPITQSLEAVKTLLTRIYHGHDLMPWRIHHHLRLKAWMEEI